LKNKWVIILVAVSFCLAVSGCDSPTPTASPYDGSGHGTDTTPSTGPGSGADTTPSGSSPTGITVPESTYTPPATDVTASDNAVMDAASAILFNDPATFTSLMSAETLTHVIGAPDLTTSDAKKIGAALQNAYIVNAEKDAFVYETTLDGVQISFMVIKEDGAWKISGL
jgi:hypothetical protein